MNKIIFTFNKFYFDFVKDLRKVSKEAHPEIRKTIKENYSCKNSDSSEYIESVEAFFSKEILTNLANGADIFTECAEANFIKNHKLSELSDIKSDALKGYLYILVLFIYMKKEDLTSDKLFELVMQYLSAIQKGENIDDIADNIVDEELVSLLKIIKETYLVCESGSEDKSTKGIENTKIGEIAKEIANDLDLDKLNISSPEDILKGNGDLLGKIVSNVSQKLQKKFEDGSIKHDELLSEAMSVIGGMSKEKGGFNIFQNLMKGMAAQQPARSKTAQRLRNKLKLKESNSK